MQNNLSTVGLARDHLAAGTKAALLMKLADDPEVLARAARDDCPIPTPHQRIGYYGQDHFGYWLSGLSDLRTMREHFSRHFDQIRGPILDFGASTGRAARHWPMEPEGFEVHACELTGRMVDWMEHHLAGRVVPHQTAVMPPLPFADDTFGVIHAFSVFSHIFDAEEAWLEELRRVARPGAAVALTIHNETTWALLPSLKFRIRDELEQNAEYRRIRAESDIMPDRLHLEQSGVSYAFYSNAHVNTVWSKYFKVLAIEDRAHTYQSMVILTPR
ncbi:class I SAM-dependent methyltransferase [Henriciella pelagia]|uniref:class I SAM-dependent methyltransferase n=1 Tax=Henriciella pelagia TaxID=1977912 RepID=UPI003511A87E